MVCFVYPVKSYRQTYFIADKCMDYMGSMCFYGQCFPIYLDSNLSSNNPTVKNRIISEVLLSKPLNYFVTCQTQEARRQLKSD